MGWFSGKKKVPLREVAEHIGGLILKGSSKENLVRLFGTFISDDDIDENFVREWIMMNLAATTKAAEISIDSKEMTVAFIGFLYRYIFVKKYQANEDVNVFVEFVEKRYSAYSERLLLQDGAIYIGVLFSEKVGTNKLEIMYAVSNYFFRMLGGTREHLKEVTTKFEITLD